MTTNPTVAAVLDFVNSSGTEVERQLRSRADLLLTDDADAVLQQLIEENHDDSESISYLRQRRRLLHECREFGVDRGLAPPQAVPAEVEQIALQYMNLRDSGELQAHVAAHLDTLTGPDAERVFRNLRLTYLDDDTIQEHMLAQMRSELSIGAALLPAGRQGPGSGSLEAWHARAGWATMPG